MIPTISTNYGTAIKDDDRQFLARLKYNGTEIACDIVNIQITKGSVGSTDAFNVGAVVSSLMTAEVKGLADDLRGLDITVEIGLFIPADNAYEYIQMGAFTVTEVKKTLYTSSITAYGFTVTKTGQAFTPPSTLTLANIATEIGTEMGVTVSFDSIDTTKTIEASMENLTTYQALQVCATVVGGYAVDTYDGNVIIRQFDDTVTESVDSGMMVRLPEVSETDFSVTGVLVIVREASEDEDGNIIPAIEYPSTPLGTENLILASSYVTSDLYSILSASLTGYEYRPALIDLTLGDPRLEGDDVLSVTDADGSTYVVPCHSVTHIYDGGLRTRIVASAPTAQEDNIATAAPITQQLSAINAATISAQTSAASALSAATTANDAATQAVEAAGEAVDSAALAADAATNASNAAKEASDAATSATTYANSALGQLSEVEKVVDVLNWIADHGIYAATSDTNTVPGKYYFTVKSAALTTDTAISKAKPYYTESGGVYTYVEEPVLQDIGTYYEVAFQIVTDPTGDPSDLGYYELSKVDEAVSNYVSTHLALTDDGLFVQIDDSACKLQITSTGILLYDAAGVVIAQYGSSIILGDVSGQHIEQTSGELGFYNGSSKVAYISANKLHITSAEVEQNLQIGVFRWRTFDDNPNRIALVYTGA